jgi:hypothetical protein
MDEAWNPKARVGHVVPKKDRPIREGTMKKSVEKCLEATAAMRINVPVSYYYPFILMCTFLFITFIVFNTGTKTGIYKEETQSGSSSHHNRINKCWNVCHTSCCPCRTNNQEK